VPEPKDSPERAITRVSMGIIRLRAAAATFQVFESEIDFIFRAEHDPLDHNFHHCVLAVYHDGIRLTEAESKKKGPLKKAFETARKYWRDELVVARNNGQIALILHSEAYTKDSVNRVASGF
jgi:hypothetical protein